MNPRFFAAIFLLLSLVPQSHSEPSSDALARLGLMRIIFHGFDVEPNPLTKRNEYVVHVIFQDIPIPKQPLVLRRGDKVAGYLIGELKNPEPKQTANDGIVPGTETTLEITHIDSGEKHVMQVGQRIQVTRDR